MDTMVLKGHSINIGVAEGEALVTDKAFSFAHGIDPNTGKLTDAEIPEWLGQSVKGKVLVFPYGKGSSIGGMYICQAAKKNNTPMAIINIETDPICAVGFILTDILFDMKIPIVDQLEKNPIELIKTGDRVKVDGDKGFIEVYHK